MVGREKEESSFWNFSLHLFGVGWGKAGMEAAFGRRALFLKAVHFFIVFFF